MPFEIPRSENREFKLPPAGTHIAILLSVVDLGTQETTWQGQKKHARKIRFTWELPFEKDKFGEDKEERPFVVSKEYTLSMADRATMRKDLESWRGKPFTDAEIGSFDETKILGKPCSVTILHKEVGDKTYANVTSVTNIPKGTQVPEPFGPTFSYNTRNGVDTTYLSLPDWLKEKIAKSPEFQTFSRSDEDAPEGHFPETEEDSEIPF